MDGFQNRSPSPERMGKDEMMPIAIIGFSFTFPQGATSADSFWDMLMNGHCTFTEIPDDRLNHEAFRHPDANRRSTLPVRGAHFVNHDIAAFDAPFFSMAAAEADAVDPQQRGLLETAYKAFENAGLSLEDVAGSNTSVYAGYFTADYSNMSAKDPERMAKYTVAGLGGSMVSGRLSKFFDLRGTSMMIDTACSSSLVALDHACASLREGKAEMSLVAGCNLVFSPDMIMALANMSFLSPDGQCHSFDERANGYARSEGFAVVVLKPLATAIRDGDTIRAVIRGTGTNHDGITPGVGNPSKDSQERLIKDVYRKAGLDMSKTTYVEAHGTGTPVGDPIEARAIGAAFDRQYDRDNPLYIGAVKANIGHLEATSGLAGVIKSVLVLEKGLIPPIANLTKQNPSIDAEFLNLKFPSKAIDWPNPGVRRASVNSFGFSGTNAHVILDDAGHYLQEHGLRGKHCTQLQSQGSTSFSQPTSCEDSACPGSHGSVSSNMNCDSGTKLLVWSAIDVDALHRLKSQYLEYFAKINLSKDDAKAYLDSLAYTLGVRRSHFSFRMYALVESLANLQSNLPIQMAAERCIESPKVAFIFTGQGAQWCGMGGELRAYSVYDKSILDADQYLKSLGCPWSVLEELSKEQRNSSINEPARSQPLCTILQVALVDLLGSFGLEPAAVVGHSSGEIAAAYCAGAISSHSAWKIAYYRGLVSQKMADQQAGGMMAVSTSEEAILPYLDQVAHQLSDSKLYVACVNSPKNVTIAGDPIHLDMLSSLLNTAGVLCRRLQVPVAYHSPSMQLVADEYASYLGDLDKDAADRCCCPMTSSVTGKAVRSRDLAQAHYWVQNMVRQVRFSDAIKQICSHMPRKVQKKLDGSHRDMVVVDDFLEVGPHAALKRPLQEILESTTRTGAVNYNSVLVRSQSASQTALTAVGKLYQRGYHIGMSKANNQNDYSQIQVLTDLPEYPFDRSRTYWHESRRSREFRLRRCPRVDLLGTLSPDSNPLDSKWCNIIQSSEMQWTEDHKVSGVLVYPAAGMLVMAIEALAILAMDNEATAFELKDVSFYRPFKLSQVGTGVETHFTLHNAQAAQDASNLQSEFRLYVLEEDNWVDICCGTIRLELENTSGPQNSGCANVSRLECAQHTIKNRANECRNSITSGEMYECFNRSGYEYGPAFQPLMGIHYSGTKTAVATVQAFKQDADSLQSHVIHPTTLDGIFQLVFAALLESNSQELPTLVPTRLKKMRISRAGLSFANSDAIHASARVDHQTKNSVNASVVAFSEPSLTSLVVEGLEMTKISRAQALESSDESTHLCFSIDWRPDLDLADSNEISCYCQDFKHDDEPVCFYEDLNVVLFAFLVDAIEAVPPGKIDPVHQRYYAWMQQQFSNHTIAPVHRTSSEVERLKSRIANANPLGEVFVKVGCNLPQLLSGDLGSLDLLLEDDALERFYAYTSDQAQCYDALNRYLDCLVHKIPNMKIMEIGAGTGAATKRLLETPLSGEEKTRCGPHIGPLQYAQYDFTDASASFLESARDKWKSHPRMQFRTFNVTNDLSTQGFNEAYDLIIAANVLRFTENLTNTLQNIRQLLRPGGKLILVEITKPELLQVDFIFGLLPEWWIGSEDYRKDNPCLSEDQWDLMLRANGFSGNDVVFDDYESSICHAYSIIVTTADTIKNEQTNIVPTTIISIEQRATAEALAARIDYLDASKRTILSLEEIGLDTLTSETCCIVLESTPLLWNLNPTEFTCIQMLFRSVRNVLWVSGGGGSHPHQAEFGLLNGLSRVVREEMINLKLTTLALEDPNNIDEKRSKWIAQIFHKMVYGQDPGLLESEYVECDGMLQVGRIATGHSVNHHIRDTISQEGYSLQKIKGEIPLKLNVRTPGLLDSLVFQEDEDQSSFLAADEVLVRVEAIGVNFMDCLVALGRVDSEAIGSECTGIIERAGAQSGYSGGERVIACILDTFKTHVRAPAANTYRLPDNMDFCEAAAIPINFVTAIRALQDIARLSKGESVLIHSAAGGTGQAAIQVAQSVEAEIYATVGSHEKRSLIRHLYGIPDDHIFSSRDTTFAESLLAMTKGKGVDVVLNSIAGEGLAASWECIAPYGRFVEIGKKDIYSHSQLSMNPFKKNATFSAVDIASMGIERPDLIQPALRKAMELVGSLKKSGFVQFKRYESFPDPQELILNPQAPLSVIPFSDVEKAFRYMQSGKNSGKIVMQVTEDDQVQALLKKKCAYRFNGNATYVIAGGLGGIGRSIAQWMVQNGAKHLLLLSRSGATSREQKEFLSTMEEAGVAAYTPACDISDFCALQNLLGNWNDDHRPIKGCIQASMVVASSVFDSMSFEQWTACIKPKVQGSFNLHKLLPSELDFFILLSSISGIIGAGGEANYAAGNTYQDALARQRVTQGEKAVSIDLSIVASEGFLAQNKEIMVQMSKRSHLQLIDQNELLALLEYYCDPSLPVLDPWKSQVVTGLETPAMIQKKGGEVAYYFHQPLFRALHQVDAVGETTVDASKQDFRVRIRAATSISEAATTVAHAAIWKLAQILPIEEADMKLDQPLHAYGVDSLLTLELRNWLKKEFDADIQAFEMGGGTTFSSLGGLVAQRCTYLTIA